MFKKIYFAIGFYFLSIQMAFSETYRCEDENDIAECGSSDSIFGLLAIPTTLLMGYWFSSFVVSGYKENIFIAAFMGFISFGIFGLGFTMIFHDKTTAYFLAGIALLFSLPVQAKKLKKELEDDKKRIENLENDKKKNNQDSKL